MKNIFEKEIERFFFIITGYPHGEEKGHFAIPSTTPKQTANLADSPLFIDKYTNSSTLFLLSSRKLVD